MTETERADEIQRTAEHLAASEYLSASHLASDLARLDVALIDEAAALGQSMIDSVDRVLLVGSGGSGAALLTAQHILDRLTPIPVQVLTGLDVVWRRPQSLGTRTAVVLASYSGRTVDVIEALAHVRRSGSPTLAITGNGDSELASRCDHVLVYEGAAIYEVPILLLLALFSGTRSGREVADLVAELPALRRAIDTSLTRAAAEMRTLAEHAQAFDHVIVSGAGPLASLAFKLAPVLMENVRIAASYYDAAEMRHGPLEFLDRHRPPLLGLLGTDESRDVAASVFQFWRSRGPVLVIDAADYPAVHPMLTPIVLNPLAQWFVAWSAHLRGIDDLDERVYMGKGLFSGGRWP